MCIEKLRVLTTVSLTAIRVTEDRSHQISYLYKAYNFVFGTSVYGSCLIYIVAPNELYINERFQKIHATEPLSLT